MMGDDGDFSAFIVSMMKWTFWLMAIFGFLFFVLCFVLMAIMGLGG